jgi:hypothetical protein
MIAPTRASAAARSERTSWPSTRTLPAVDQGVPRVEALAETVCLDCV